MGSAGCIASVSPADTPVSPADSANGVLRRTIRHILLSFNKLDIMAHLLLFFWTEGHDKQRPKETCFNYPTGSERRRAMRPPVGHHAEETEGLEEGGAL